MAAQKECKPSARLRPVVNHNQCEGKADCVRVCPMNVFEVRRIEPSDQMHLSLIGRLKKGAHGGRSAFTPRADACESCGLCVDACPEKAITLQRAP